MSIHVELHEAKLLKKGNLFKTVTFDMLLCFSSSLTCSKKNLHLIVKSLIHALESQKCINI